MRDVHWCVTVFYQQIENGNIANQIQGFTIDYGKFILIWVMQLLLYYYIMLICMFSRAFCESHDWSIIVYHRLLLDKEWDRPANDWLKSLLKNCCNAWLFNFITVITMNYSTRSKLGRSWSLLTAGVSWTWLMWFMSVLDVMNAYTIWIHSLRSCFIALYVTRSPSFHLTVCRTDLTKRPL